MKLLVKGSFKVGLGGAEGGVAPRLWIRAKVGGPFAYAPQSSAAQLFFANLHLNASYTVLNFALIVLHVRRGVRFVPPLFSLSMLSESRQVQ